MSVYSYNQMAGREEAANRQADEALPHNHSKAKRMALIKKAAEKR